MPEIKTLNGYSFNDTKARQDIETIQNSKASIDDVNQKLLSFDKKTFSQTVVAKSKDITVESGKSIGYASGVQIYINIPSGTSYTYRLDDPDGVFNANYALYECHAEGEDTRLYGNQRNTSFTKTSTADVVGFRIYVMSASVKAGTVSLSVSFVNTNTDSLESELKSDLTTKITKPEDAPSVGKVLRVKQVNDDGSFVCEWATGGSGGSTDVQINGTSITNDGVANIPYGSQTEYGVAKFVQSNGLVANNGIPYVSGASDQNISRRDTLRTALMPKHINNIVKAALTDSNRITGLTSAEMDNACAVVGAVRQKKYTLLNKYTVESETDTITLSSDSAGSPYNLKKMIVKAEIPAGNAMNGKSYRVNINTGMTASYFSVVNSSNYSIFATTRIDVSEGFLVSNTAYSTYSISNASNYINRVDSMWNMVDAINRVDIKTTSVFPVGTQIYVYGIE